jgi:hypothetical protein
MQLLESVAQAVSVEPLQNVPAALHVGSALQVQWEDTHVWRGPHAVPQPPQFALSLV